MSRLEEYGKSGAGEDRVPPEELPPKASPSGLESERFTLIVYAKSHR